MRVALGIHGYDLEKAFETYELMSLKYFTHATPTLFNAGTPRGNLSSCFLLGMDDSIEGIFGTVTNIAYISKWAGGIGVHLSGIRAKGSLIRGTNGLSDGILPLCLLLNREAKYINQGGKRQGSVACFLEPWHSDINDFLELRLPNGDEERRARDLFLALWIPDLFMKRVLEKGKWSLMCPDECPGLPENYGEKFEELYIKYENEGRFKKQIDAIELWNKILASQIETGLPYMLYKDTCNIKSNQKNLGTIRSSNLCSEIIEYSDGKEIAVCNLASICLPRFIETNAKGEKFYNFDKLIQISKIITYNLNKVIDINFYPVESAKISNLKHRPIGIGVQGLADVFNIMGMPFGSEEARLLNKQIHESIYYGSLYESCELSKINGPYETFTGSDFSKGILQFDYWNINKDQLMFKDKWNDLKEEIIKYGTRNSLLTALMPTASTAQIMANSEAFEPYMSNTFVRSTLAGEFVIINQNLVMDLLKLGIWSDKIRKQIIFNTGSIQTIMDIPAHIREIYKTAFEIKQRDIIQQSIDRGAFVDQSQSLNLFMGKPDNNILSSAHFFGWKNGIKTGMYYLRNKPAVLPLQFGLDVEKKEKDDKPECLMCSA
jgi:ribonucleoside-diphosphate reductase alpha subunit